MKRSLVVFVFLCAALSLLIGTPALSSRVSGLTKALEQLPPEDLREVLENLGFSPFPAPVPKTGATYDDPSAIGDDGELQMGVAWPVPRFTDNNDGTVTDNLTGLVWTRDANIFGKGAKGWACRKCTTLKDGEHGLTDGSVEGDWRLPNVKELKSLISYAYYYPAVPNTQGTGKWREGDPFTRIPIWDWDIFNGQPIPWYWSSTIDAKHPDSGLGVNFYDGSEGFNGAGELFGFYVWCVRDSK